MIIIRKAEMQFVGKNTISSHMYCFYFALNGLHMVRLYPTYSV